MLELRVRPRLYVLYRQRDLEIKGLGPEYSYSMLKVDNRMRDSIVPILLNRLVLSFLVCFPDVSDRRKPAKLHETQWDGY